MSEDLIILTRTFDMLEWLLPSAEKFPKNQRFVLTQRLTDSAFNFVESLYLAQAHVAELRLQHLRDADAHLNTVRLYLRLVHRQDWLSDGQYQHISKMIAEIGRLLGGWIRQTLTNGHT